MKKNILLLSALLLNANSIIEAKENVSSNTTAESAKKINKVKPKDKKSLTIKSGDILNLSEFTKTNAGIMYLTTTKGSGNKPVQGETVVVHYDLYLLVDGKKVGIKCDSSVDRDMPFSFKLGARQVITGWEITLADMKIGETRIVILPSKLAYGNRATSKIPADSSLIFEITLIKAS